MEKRETPKYTFTQNCTFILVSNKPTLDGTEVQEHYRRKTLIVLQVSIEMRLVLGLKR